jgi:hypothetical protein
MIEDFVADPLVRAREIKSNFYSELNICNADKNKLDLKSRKSIFSGLYIRINHFEIIKKQ